MPEIVTGIASNIVQLEQNVADEAAQAERNLNGVRFAAEASEPEKLQSDQDIAVDNENKEPSA